MQPVIEIWGEGSKAEDRAQRGIIWGLRGVMMGRYGDVVLLCTVTAAFIMLLAFSAFSPSS